MKKFIIRTILFLSVLILSLFVVYQCQTFITSPLPQTINQTNERINESDFVKLGFESNSFNYLFDYDVEYKKTMYLNGKYLGFQAKINNIEVTNEQIKSHGNYMIDKYDGYLYSYTGSSVKMSVYGKDERCIFYLDSRCEEKILYIFLKIKDF